jgi:hypothetical protein
MLFMQLPKQNTMYKNSTITGACVMCHCIRCEDADDEDSPSISFPSVGGGGKVEGFLNL